MNKDNMTPYQQFSHNCKWQWLTDRVTEENRWERVALSIRQLRLKTGLRIGPELQKAMKLK